ncbi:hypothetical protein A9798_03650 [Edwardsiella hoshinae]|uniref:Big-1 domain-containing protein n=1 Tax=Edwardsiella hoshinae TaxID=93378 RepID=A0ABM6EH73_9GAMM|nr:inverse autotransporter beta domain-containing protein [Edwardsiella hoshinae]AOV96134.1 hypothetical protein A9798_03650 [Edwardsiella hoshinae]
MSISHTLHHRTAFGLLIYWLLSTLILPLYPPLAQASRGDESLPSLEINATDTGQAGDENAIAEHLRLWGNVLAAPSPTAAVGQLAGNQISAQANQFANETLRDWLGQQGKGNVNVQFTRHGTGSADLLLPWYDTENRLLFSQLGGRIDEDRTILNGGIGWRQYIAERWMLGGNAFYDYDASAGNARWGLGLEARTDWLSLSINRYFRLTDWRASSQAGYDERPAEGYDTQLKYWLPMMPTLGGELSYEKYFGEGVALSGTGAVNALKTSPYTLTTAVNYTPFPLLTLSVGQKMGDVSETVAKLEFNWRFGLPLAAQLDSANMAMLRSLQGSRYDLVARNYDIVMQYRRQPSATLSLPLISGVATNRVEVHARVQASAGLRDVLWQADALQAAGGALFPGNKPTDITLLLPPWNPPESGRPNQYALSAQLIDTDGNRSEPVVTTITVLDAGYSPQVSLSTAHVAAGKEISADLTVTDEQGKPAAKMPVHVTVTAQSSPPAPLQYGAPAALISPALEPTCLINGQPRCDGFDTQTDDAGKLPLRLASTKAGVHQLTARLATGNQISQEIIFTADPASAQMAAGALSVTTNNAPADGLSANRVTARVSDHYGNPLSGQRVTFTARDEAQLAPAGQASGQGAKTADVLTDNNGRAAVDVTQTRAGNSVIDAQLNGSRQQVTLHFVADSGSARLVPGSLHVTQRSATASGPRVNLASIKVTDSNGNPLPGETVIFTVTQGAYLAPVGIPNEAQGTALTTLSRVTDRDGLAQVVLHSRSVSRATLSAALANQPSAQTVEVSFAPSVADPGRSALQLSQSTIVADGNTSSTLQLTLKDRQGNPLVRTRGVAFQVIQGNTADYTLSAVDYRQAAAGIYSASLTATGVGHATLGVTLDGQPLPLSPVAVQSTLPGNTVTLTLTATPPGPLTADGTSSATITATAQDAFGQALQNIPLRVSASNGAILASGAGNTGSTLVVPSDANGNATFTLRSRLAGISTVSVQLDAAPALASVTSRLDIRFVPGDISVTRSSLTASTATMPDGNAHTVAIEANGTDSVTLTLDLRDSQGNPINGLDSGIAFSVTDSDTASPATTRLTLSPVNYEQAERGIYHATLTGTQAGRFTLSAHVTLGGQSYTIGTAASVQLLLLPGPPQSPVLTSSASSLVADGQSTTLITLRLVDRHGNPLVDKAPRLTLSGAAATFSAGTALDTTSGTMQHNGNGEYRITLRSGTTSGTTVVTLEPASVGLAADAAATTLQIVMMKPVLKLMAQAADYSFANDSGFPHTGFARATFTLKFPNGTAPLDAKAVVTGSQNTPTWLTVNDSGVVTFNRRPASGEQHVTITLTSLDGERGEYHINLRHWFVNEGASRMNPSVAQQSCQVVGGRLPTVRELTNSSQRAYHDQYGWEYRGSYSQRRAVGNLWSEWGNMAFYPGSNFYTNDYWTRDEAGRDAYMTVSLQNGDVNGGSLSDVYNVTCLLAL